jgi:asparagine synthase (glutamine-hydrolysing)
MCGIAGEFCPNGQTAGPGCMAEITDAMSHRGPDGRGIWHEREGRCTLGHRRLSIIDLAEAAGQPMLNHTGDIALVFNGEIYNHAEIRRELEALGIGPWKTDHSDTEVLLKAYEQWGLSCVDRFYGMFAFAVYDARNPAAPVLHLARDRVGIKPLYLARAGQSWVFASEIRALMRHPDISPQMDYTALWHYLTFIVTPAPLTLFKGVFKLAAGHIVSIDCHGQAEDRCYWDCAPSLQDTWKETDISFEEAVEEFTRLMKQSIARRMVSDVPFGVLLSGGVDSSLNVALMSEIMDRPVTTFSIGYEGEDDINEFTYAGLVAGRYKTRHFTTRINARDAQDFLPLMVQLQDEPIADNVCIPLYFLAKLVKDSGTTVVQVGEGADENFLGYWWCEHYRQKYQDIWSKDFRGGLLRRLWGKNPLPGDLSEEDKAILARKAAGQELFWGGAVCWWNSLRDKLTPKPFGEAVSCPVRNMLPAAHAVPDSAAVVDYYLKPLGRLAAPEVLQKITYMEMKLRLPEHLLMRVDKLTMAHSIEARVPFLDHDLVDFARRLPLSYKLDNGLGKRIVKKAAEPYLPSEIIYRKKQGFGAPVDRWLKDERFARRVRGLVDRSTLMNSGLFDKEFFSAMLNTEITQGGGNSFYIWTVLNALLWHEHWIEKNAGSF